MNEYILNSFFDELTKLAQKWKKPEDPWPQVTSERQVQKSIRRHAKHVEKVNPFGYPHPDTREQRKYLKRIKMEESPKAQARIARLNKEEWANWMKQREARIAKLEAGFVAERQREYWAKRPIMRRVRDLKWTLKKIPKAVLSGIRVWK